MIHGAIAHPSASLSQGHIKLWSVSGHSAKVGVEGEGRGNKANHVGMWRVGVGSCGGVGARDMKQIAKVIMIKELHCCCNETKHVADEPNCKLVLNSFVFVDL